MISVTNKFIEFIINNVDAVDKSTSEAYYDKFVSSMVEQLSKFEYTIDELKLIEQEFVSYFQKLYSKEILTATQMNDYINNMYKYFASLDYTLTYNDKGMKFIVWLYKHKDKIENMCNFKEVGFDSKEMCDGVRTILELYDILHSRESRFAIMHSIYINNLNRIHSIGDSRDIRNSPENIKNCMSVASMLDFYDKDNEKAFFNECNIIAGIEKTGDSDLYNLTDEDIKEVIDFEENYESTKFFNDGGKKS